jgi:signal transduction histidine kinase
VPEQVALSTKIALFRAIQELLSNALRHGQGAAVRVHLASDGTFLQLAVTDDGPGFDVASLEAEAGLGLAGMREQAELLGGDFEILSRPGSGTETRVRWPLTRARRPPGAPAVPAETGTPRMPAETGTLRTPAELPRTGMPAAPGMPADGGDA